MKRILALILPLLLSLCACGQRISEEEAIAIAVEEVENQIGLRCGVFIYCCLSPMPQLLLAPMRKG